MDCNSVSRPTSTPHPCVSITLVVPICSQAYPEEARRQMNVMFEKLHAAIREKVDKAVKAVLRLFGGTPGVRGF